MRILAYLSRFAILVYGEEADALKLEAIGEFGALHGLFNEGSRGNSQGVLKKKYLKEWCEQVASYPLVTELPH